MNGDAMPLVTIITPAYNVAPYIQETVQSVLAQTETHFEYLIVDDESTDDTRSVAAAAAGGDPRVRILTPSHGGAGAARNAGLRAARGQYISFIDGDDRWHARKLQRQLEVLESAPGRVGGVFCWSRLITERGQWIGVQTSRPGLYDFDRFIEGYSPQRNGSSMLFRRIVFDEAGEFDESLPIGEDSDMWLRVTRTPTAPLLQGHRDLLVDYRLRGGSLMHEGEGKQTWQLTVIDRHSPAMRRLPRGAAYVKPAVVAYGRGEENLAAAFSKEAHSTGLAFLVRRSIGVKLLLWEAIGLRGRNAWRAARNYSHRWIKWLLARSGSAV